MAAWYGLGCAYLHDPPEVPAMSIVRVGLAETKKFAEGYDLIFGKKDDKDQQADKKEDKKDDTATAAQDSPPQPE
jgi:hypothetical protein